MRVNENMSWMRSHISKLSDKNRTANLKMQESRNQRLFGKKPEYLVIDLIQDICEMNQQQFEWFVESISVYDRKRVGIMLENFSEVLEDVDVTRSMSLPSFLIEMTEDERRKRIKELSDKINQRQDVIFAGKMHPDDNRTKILSKEIDEFRKEIRYLASAKTVDTPADSSKESSSGAAADGAKGAADTTEKPKTRERKPRGGSTKSKPGVLKPDEQKQGYLSQFVSSAAKHRNLLLSPAGEGLAYYARRAKEIGGDVARGLADVGGRTVGAIARGVKTGATKIAKSKPVKKAVKYTKEKFSQGAEALKSKLAKVAETGKTKLASGVEAAKEKAGSAAEGTGRFIGKLFNRG